MLPACLLLPNLGFLTINRSGKKKLSFFILLLCAGAAYKGWAKKSTFWFACAGALLGLSWVYPPYAGVWGPFYAVRYGFLPILILAAVGFGVSKFYFKAKGIAHDNASQPNMTVVVGRVLDTNTSQTVYSNVHVGHDVMGNLSSYTTHNTQLNHNTWLRDLNNDVDVNYSGSGSIQARPGHVLGTMSYDGTSYMDVNYSTGGVFTLPKTVINPFASVVMAVVMVIFGWAFFPVAAVACPLVWYIASKSPTFTARGMWFSTKGPGSVIAETILTYGGGILYGVCAFGVLQALEDENGTTAIVSLCTLIAGLFILHQYAARLKFKREVALYRAGRTELDKLYETGMTKDAARAPAGTVSSSAIPVATS